LTYVFQKSAKRLLDLPALAFSGYHFFSFLLNYLDAFALPVTSVTSHNFADVFALITFEFQN
jgi:hypothetical protein